MNNHQPLVSVIIPAYNAEAFIAQTLHSVISQTYKNIEIFVVDDGSQDRTAEIVKSFAQKDNRIVFFKQANSGVAAARNLAIHKSSGEYIAPIDADDIWDIRKIEKQVKLLLSSEPSVGLVYTRSVFIDEQGSVIGKYHQADNFFDSQVVEGDVYTALLYSNFLANASVPLIRRACFEQVGYYNCKLRAQNAQGCEDWDMHMRIAEFYQFRVVPEFLVGYRQVVGSMSANYKKMEKSYYLVVADVKKRHPEIPNFVYQWSASRLYIYLLNKSFTCGNYVSTLTWMKKAIIKDFLLLLDSGLYRVFISSIIKIIFKPFISLIWKDHKAWLKFKQQLKNKHQEPQKVLAISDMNGQIIIENRQFRKLYDKVLQHRWLQVLQGYKSVFPQQVNQKNIDILLPISFPKEKQCKK
ncbi:family 2 glycosyl transferase [Nostocales cyanobacterium HT-58-2]|nr:family 2 glycosyl transferase [Nostocales cyanobacterium HT-58-2]